MRQADAKYNNIIIFSCWVLGVNEVIRRLGGQGACWGYVCTSGFGLNLHETLNCHRSIRRSNTDAGGGAGTVPHVCMYVHVYVCTCTYIHTMYIDIHTYTPNIGPCWSYQAGLPTPRYKYEKGPPI